MKAVEANKAFRMQPKPRRVKAAPFPLHKTPESNLLSRSCVSGAFSPAMGRLGKRREFHTSHCLLFPRATGCSTCLEVTQVWAGSAQSTPGPSKQPTNLSYSSYQRWDFQENQEVSDLRERTLPRSQSKSGGEVDRGGDSTQDFWYPSPLLSRTTNSHWQILQGSGCGWHAFFY